MPFTPITEAYLDPDYVKEEYPVLATVLDRPDDPVEEEWKGFVHLDHAILDPVRVVCVHDACWWKWGGVGMNVYCMSLFSLPCAHKPNAHTPLKTPTHIQAAAWDEVLALKMFDSGNSLANSLYWIATRPGAETFKAAMPTDTTNGEGDKGGGVSSDSSSKKAPVAAAGKAEGGKAAAVEP